MNYENSNEKIYQEYIDQRKRIIKMINKNNIFNKENIINNEDKMNILIILLLYDKLNDEDESINFNRFLYSDVVNFKQIKDYLTLEKILEIENNSILIFPFQETF